jgi:hypothetical protein
MPREDIESTFPNLRLEGWDISSEIDDGYNCIAFAVHDTRQFWDPDMVGVRGYYWPPGIPRDWRVSTLIKLYEIHGFRVCENAGLEKGFEKVVIYSTSSDNATHAARQKASGIWTSKLGSDEDIEHETPEGLAETIYGKATVIMKRQMVGTKKPKFNILRFLRSLLRILRRRDEQTEQR